MRIDSHTVDTEVVNVIIDRLFGLLNRAQIISSDDCVCGRIPRLGCKLNRANVNSISLRLECVSSGWVWEAPVPFPSPVTEIVASREPLGSFLSRAIDRYPGILGGGNRVRDVADC